MQQRYFYVPFGKNGTITEIPMATDPTGLVSYNIGWGTDYELDMATNPAAKAVDAASSNGILYDITYALQNLQQYGTAEFIDAADNQGSAFVYDIYAMCHYSSTGTSPFTPFMSLVANNVAVPAEGVSWSRVANLKDINTAVAAEALLRSNTDTTLANAISAETARAEAAEAARALLAGSTTQPFSASKLTAPVVGGAPTYLSLTAATFTQSANLAVTALVPHWCAPAPAQTPNAAVNQGQFPSSLGTSTGYKKYPDPNSPTGYFIEQWSTTNTAYFAANGGSGQQNLYAAFEFAFPNAVIRTGLSSIAPSIQNINVFATVGSASVNGMNVDINNLNANAQNISATVWAKGY